MSPVDSLANQIDVTLAFADLQRNVRVAGEKLQQRGQKQGPRQVARHVCQMVPEMLPGAAVGLLKGRQNGHAALIIPTATSAVGRTCQVVDVAAAPETTSNALIAAVATGRNPQIRGSGTE